MNKIGKLLDINLDQVFTLINTDEDSSKKHPFPCPTTYRTALSYYVEITALPRTHILKELSVYTTDAEQRAQLELMASTTAEGKALYQSWVVDSCRHIAHILEDMDTCSLRPSRRYTERSLRRGSSTILSLILFCLEEEPLSRK